jgi:hypothetical protein
MAIIYSYPLKATPKTTDKVIISDMESTNPNFQTKQSTIQSIIDLGNPQDAWSTLHVTSNGVVQSDIVAVGTDQAWTIDTIVGSAVELTSAPVTSTLSIDVPTLAIANNNLGFGGSGTFLAAVTDSIAIGVNYVVANSYNIQFTTDASFSPDINFETYAGGAGGGGNSNINLKGTFNISGNGNLVTPYELSLEYEQTRFAGQTITKEQMNVWDGVNPIEIDWNSGDVQVIDLNNQAAALVLNYPLNIEPGSYTIRLEQGPAVATPAPITFNAPISGQWYWPSGVPGAITNAVSAQDILNIHSDGTNLYGTMINDFQ